MRMIFVWFVKLGPPVPKISAGVARDSTLLRFIEILKVDVQVKSFRLILTVFSANSKPLFSMLPMFFVIEPYPLEVGTGAANNMFVVFLEYRSASIAIRLL